MLFDNNISFSGSMSGNIISGVQWSMRLDLIRVDNEYLLLNKDRVMAELPTKCQQFRGHVFYIVLSIMR